MTNSPVNLPTHQPVVANPVPWPDRFLALLWGFSKSVAVLLILFFVLVSWGEIRALVPRISRFEALGVKLEMPALRSALEEQAKSVRGTAKTKAGAIESVLTRAEVVQPVFQGATILWVDDDPANNMPFRQLLRMLGAAVEVARSTDEALQLCAVGRFDLVVSDIKRERENGIDGLAILRTAGFSAPAVFYVLEIRDGPIPGGALGLTNMPDDLLHLVIDGLERSRWSTSRPNGDPTRNAEGAGGSCEHLQSSVPHDSRNERQ